MYGIRDHRRGCFEHEFLVIREFGNLSIGGIIEISGILIRGSAGKNNTIVYKVISDEFNVFCAIDVKTIRHKTPVCLKGILFNSGFG